MTGEKEAFSQQVDALREVLQRSGTLWQVVEKSRDLGLSDYYIGAGCVAQTVWNLQNGNPSLWGIDDIDFVYFDEDLSPEAEEAAAQAVRQRFGDCPLRFDVKNEARVHLWYQSRFGYEIAPYPSLERALDTWPTTATAVGVRLEGDTLRVYAPYGLGDLLSQTVRPNKVQITKEIYDRKVLRWTALWPTLTVIPW